jgi:hypothetical protein
MLGFQPKIRPAKCNKKHSEETKQVSEPGSDMTQMLKLSDRQF